MSKQTLMDCFLPSFRVECYHDKRIIPYSYHTPPVRFTDHLSLLSSKNLNQIVHSKHGINQSWCSRFYQRTQGGYGELIEKSGSVCPTCRRISRHFGTLAKRNLCTIKFHTTLSSGLDKKMAHHKLTEQLSLQLYNYYTKRRNYICRRCSCYYSFYNYDSSF